MLPLPGARRWPSRPAAQISVVFWVVQDATVEDSCLEGVWGNVHHTP